MFYLGDIILSTLTVMCVVIVSHIHIYKFIQWRSLNDQTFVMRYHKHTGIFLYKIQCHVMFYWWALCMHAVKHNSQSWSYDGFNVFLFPNISVIYREFSTEMCYLSLSLNLRKTIHNNLLYVKYFFVNSKSIYSGFRLAKNISFQ